MSIKIVLTTTNDAKISSHICVPVTGASKDVSIQVTMLLPTEIVKEVLTSFVVVINSKITCNGRHQHVEEWVKMGSPDSVILYLSEAVARSQKILDTENASSPKSSTICFQKDLFHFTVFFSFSVLQTRGIMLITWYLLLIHVHNFLGSVSAECLLFCNNC